MERRERNADRVVEQCFEEAPICLLLCDERGRAVRSNAAFRELFPSAPTDALTLERRLGGRLAIVDAVRRALEGERVRLGPSGRDSQGAAETQPHASISATFVAIRSTVDGRRYVLGEFHEESGLGERSAALLERLARTEASNRAKDDFFSVLSHELRSPLNAMSMWVHLLRRGMLDDKKTAHALEVIDRAIESQTRLINDLVDISRISAGKLVVESRWLDLAEVAKEAAELARGQAQAKGLTFDVLVEPRRMPVRGDRGRIQQIIGNLLSNSIKFTPAGGRVELDVHASSSLARIVVRDSGVGIDEALLPHVFERFRQADSSITRRQSGLGLGLTISRRLVELHGGSISAESPGPERGATFTVSLPLGPADQPIGTESTREREALPLLAALSVLVVDDEAEARASVTTVLASCGADTHGAASAVEAAEIFSASRIDVVLVDIAMPDEDGYALLARLRAQDRARGTKTPVIALTGFADEDHRKRVVEAGFDLHLTKPVPLDELVVAVSMAAGGRSAQFARERTEEA
jgi:signal transduction histidine kinase/AmiR/NasT family two-component response regulator